MLRFNLLSLKPLRRRISFLFIVITFILAFMFAFSVKTFDSLPVTGLMSCNDLCQISITLSYDNADVFSKDSFISYNNHSYDIWDVEYGEPYLNGEVAYVDVTFYTNLNTSNSLINFKILSNREKIIDKIKNIILER